MKFTSKKLFYFAFIIIFIGIIWTMLFSKTIEGYESQCYKYHNDSAGCTTNGCIQTTDKRGVTRCQEKTCSNFSNALYNDANASICINQKLRAGNPGMNGKYCKATKYWKDGSLICQTQGY